MSAGKETLTYPGKRVVRFIGALLTTVCCLMVVLGATVWAERLQGPRYVLYWSWCFLLLVLTLAVALLDLVMIRRASRQTRRQLFHDQFRSR
jgi:cobalamin biosynthesis protein CobD/CbiB